jgi:hypothetical protein
VDSADNVLIGEVQHALNQLQLHATIMDMHLRTSKEQIPAREGWRQRLRETRDWAYQCTEEIHAFGEAFDPPSDSAES